MNRIEAEKEIDLIYKNNFKGEEYEKRKKNIPKLLEKYEGKYDKLLEAMSRKYVKAKKEETGKIIKQEKKFLFY